MGESSSPRRVLARAPSNIAIVKYMGKSDAARNLPANASLSMTLAKLCTDVELREDRSAEASHILGGEAPAGSAGKAPALDDAGRAKFLRHFARCRERLPALFARHEIVFGSRASAAVRAANTFPAAAGIASSASSFAALTLAAAAYFAAAPAAFREKFAADPALRAALAALSREGSGSSCRSFDGPFVAWESESVERLDANLPPLSDLVVVVAAGRKEVGSSEAHRRVETSPRWSGRIDRANARKRNLEGILARGDFAAFARVAAEDTEDMHALFETSVPAFGYRSAATREVVDFLASVGSPYAYSLDAGPNVHVLVPQSDEAFWKSRLVERFPQHPLLVDRQGGGAEILEIEGDA